METTNKLLNELANTLADGYKAELEKFPMKKNIRECLVDGFRSGAHAGVRHACNMLGVTVRDESSTIEEVNKAS